MKLLYNIFISQTVCTQKGIRQMSTVKKNRRRQKKQFLDQQDLERQTEDNTEENQTQAKHKINEIQDEMFDAAKLQQGYFARKGQELDAENDKVQNINQSHKISEKIIQSSNLKEQSKPERNTDKKRRKKPALKQAIFDESDQDNQQKKIQQKLQQIISPQKQLNEKKKQQSSQVQQISQGSDHQKKDTKQAIQKPNPKDQFDNIIKDQQQQQSSQQQQIIHIHQQLNKLSKQQRKYYYYTPLQQGQVSFCYFKRITSGLSESYQLVEQDQRPLLFCQNQRGCIGCNYYISMTKQMDKTKQCYLGKLRGNAAGSMYQLYDAGQQPKNQFDRSEWRVSMAVVEYQSNFMGFNGPRKLKVTTPRANNLQDFDMFKLSEEQSLLNFKPPVVRQYRNKTPKWNEKLKSYALNFGGRVKLASIKNFIMIDNDFEINDQDQADNILIFGKVDENTFSIQYRYPLSMFQAFGIAMSEFDFKLNCE